MGLNGQLHAPATLFHESNLGSERKDGQLGPQPVWTLWKTETPSTCRNPDSVVNLILVTILTELFQTLKFHMEIPNTTHIHCRPI